MRERVAWHVCVRVCARARACVRVCVCVCVRACVRASMCAASIVRVGRGSLGVCASGWRPMELSSFLDRAWSLSSIEEGAAAAARALLLPAGYRPVTGRLEPAG